MTTTDDPAESARPVERGFRGPAVQQVAGIGFVPPGRFGDQPLRRHPLTVGGGLLLLGVVIPAALLKYPKPSRVHPDHREPSGTP
ncbi:hypothetical protein ACFRJ7_02340 [Streptomyces sp. NPDC056747]|uniref:hypothetical protein n=1 Tax=Streptomyces sp. NPDC056747 TaxID=3345935 RepID=UPI00368A70CD